MSWGRVESSVLEYKNNDPPLSMLRNFRDAKSVYSFVTANTSTHTPDWTAMVACKRAVSSKLKIYLSLRVLKYDLLSLYRTAFAPEAEHDQHQLFYLRIVHHTYLYPAAHVHNQEDQI